MEQFRTDKPFRLSIPAAPNQGYISKVIERDPFLQVGAKTCSLSMRVLERPAATQNYNFAIYSTNFRNFYPKEAGAGNLGDEADIFEAFDGTDRPFKAVYRKHFTQNILIPNADRTAVASNTGDQITIPTENEAVYFHSVHNKQIPTTDERYAADGAGAVDPLSMLYWILHANKNFAGALELEGLFSYSF